MTAVEILFRCTKPPTERESLALAGAKDVYGIRRLSFDHAARTLLVEYDATRLDPAAVAKLIRQAGLEIAADIPDAPPPAPRPAPAA
jgi:allophanate hydrolase subunit 1